MPNKHGGNILPEVTLEEHEHDALAKRVVLRAFDGSDYVTLGTESYNEGADEALAVFDAPSVTTLVTVRFAEPTATVAKVLDGSDRKKILFQASPDNDQDIYVLTASTTTYQLGVALEPGDAFIDQHPFAYNGTYWTRSFSGTQALYVEEWL